MGYFEDLKEQRNANSEAGRANIGFGVMEADSAGALDSSFYKIEQYTLDTLDVTDMGRAHEDVSYTEDGTRVTNLVLDSGDVVASAYEKTTETEGGTSANIRVEFSGDYTTYGSLDEYQDHEQDRNGYEIVKNFDSDGKIVSMEDGPAATTFRYSEDGAIQSSDVKEAVGRWNDDALADPVIYDTAHAEYDSEGRITNIVTVREDLLRGGPDLYLIREEYTYERDGSGKIVSMTESVSDMSVDSRDVGRYLAGNDSLVTTDSTYEKVYSDSAGTNGGLGLIKDISKNIYDDNGLDVRRTVTREYFDTGGVKSERIENEGAGYGENTYSEYGKDGSLLRETYEYDMLHETSEKTVLNTDGHAIYEQRHSVNVLSADNAAVSERTETVDRSITYYRDNDGSVLSSSSSEQRIEERLTAETGKAVITTNYKDDVQTDSSVKILSADNKTMYTIEKTFDKDGNPESRTVCDENGDVISSGEKEGKETFEIKSAGGYYGSVPAFCENYKEENFISTSAVYDEDGNIGSYEITVSDDEGNVLFVEKYEDGVSTLYDSSGTEREKYFIDSDGDSHIERYDENGRFEYSEYRDTDGNVESIIADNDSSFEDGVDDVVGGICGDMDSKNDILSGIDDTDNADADMDAVDADMDGLSDFDDDDGDTVD